MRLREAIASLHQNHSKDQLKPLFTPWGEHLDKANVWQEYPRPQLVRRQFEMLNGEWDCLFVHISDDPVIPGKKIQKTQKILVPFSPESLLSGVGRQLKPNEYLWYQRILSFPQMDYAKKQQLGRHCLLHFGAVDQQVTVYINGQEAFSHVGGYLPFTIDISEYISYDPCLLQIRVRDESDTSHHSRGKQTLKRGGMFYTAQSGIWQSVWYEWVPKNYIADFKITPRYDESAVRVELFSEQPFQTVTCSLKEEDLDYTVTIESDVANVTSHPHAADFPCRTVLTIRFAEGSFRPWSPEDPYLYPFTIHADEDEVESYFAMRCYSVEPDKQGIPRFCLNHRPYFLHGILDQGYWSDGLMTAPCDEAFIFDIELAKKSCFNMIRKHIKIEPLRWYYHCDRLGMIVWQDMVSGGTSYHMPLVCYMPTLFPHMTRHTKDHHYRLFSRANADGRSAWEKECQETIEHLYNVPSLAVWVPFNEGWGQFDASRIAEMIHEKDPSRPVDHASGWFDQKGGDFRSIHNYFRPLQVKLDGNRAFVISEYGGYACRIPDHSSVDRIYGYQKFDTIGETEVAFRQLVREQLFPLIDQGLSGAIYTQLSDVEEEVNGLVTYDRKVVKLFSLSAAPSIPCSHGNKPEE